MKKIALVFTIIACIGTLNGMQKEPEHGYWQYLPKELKQEIINTTSATSINLHEAILIIEKLSALHGVEFDKLFNLKDFTTLAHVLADKFNASTYQIANKFLSKVAMQYLFYGERLLRSVIEANYDRTSHLIKDGADIDYSKQMETILEQPYSKGRIK